MKFRELINGLFYNTKKDIIELAQTELNNENKKLVLDHNIVEYLEKAINGLTVNFIFKMVIKKLLLPNVSIITQWNFDLLKAKIEGVTATS